MELFLDNDIILKLGACELLKKIEDIYNTKHNFIYILPTALFYFKNSKRLKAKYSKEFLNSIIEVISEFSPIPDEYVNEDNFMELQNVENIDTGEQLLFSLIPSTNDFFILTGDKRAIKSLNNTPDLNNLKNFLKGKIIFLEMLILNFIETENFELINKKLTESTYCYDKVLKICFGQANVKKHDVKACLKSYIDDLKRDASNLF